MDEPAPLSEPQTQEGAICPNCGAPVPVERDLGDVSLHCPYCEADFIPGAGQDEEPAVEWQEPTEPDSELDGLRIRKMVQLRRSAIRARTYAVLILICCLVMGAQLILTDFQEISLYGWDRWAILYTILAGLMVIGATISSRKAAVLHRESNIPGTEPAEHAPQFDDLSDGSQQVKNLEQMQGGEER